ncbi:MAG: hypothetical protein RL516_1972 [Bacteroidota bacterium]|jgi:uncharacterized protein (DUF885 family)
MLKVKVSFPQLILALLVTASIYSCKQKTNDIDWAKASKEEDARFEKFKGDFVNQLWKLNPTSALYAGFHNYDSILIIPDANYREYCDKQYDSILYDLGDIEIGLLSPQNKTDYWMIQDYLKAGIWYDTAFKSFEWNPANYNVAGEFAEILNGRYAPLNERLTMFDKRLKNVVAYYEVAKKELKNPTIEHTDLAILQHEGSVEEVFGKNLQDSVKASTLDETTKAHLLAYADTAKKAMLDYAGYLKTMRKTMTPENSRSFRIGKELYDTKFKYDIASSYSADEIYNKAVNRKSELHHEMAELSRQLWPKYFSKEAMPADSLQLIRKMIDKLSLVHVNRDSFLESIQAQIPALVKFIKEKDLIYIDPSKPLVVRKTPAYMEGGGAGASISAPGPYDKGGNTYYNVSPLTGYSPEQAESYLREYNQYILQILNIHEAIPGHYTQLVYSNNSPSIIKSIMGNGAMVEGWAVYTERMMLENGYGNNEPEMWLMYYKWHLRSVCNTILDYSVHVKNMSEQDAMKLLVDGAFQQTAEAQGKWKRVRLTQVQLTSYYTGFTEIYELRESMKSKDFNLKKFHEQFLSYGSAPVKYIRDLMNEKK